MKKKLPLILDVILLLGVALLAASICAGWEPNKSDYVITLGLYLLVLINQTWHDWRNYK